uniref:Small ribosomal subunit protein uS8c n=1 Tax=Cylindrocystis brebissonii TaxID=102167 RepID=A0A191T672_9VIRI|nr:ribosomal protein S8 [Cylindrocystis brebissonii]ANI25901.1 ribosomal protein S8 [Cylindrocystis brebissonii]
MSNNAIANMITSIRNANLTKSKTVEVLATRTTRSIAKILLKEGFVSNLRERALEGPLVNNSVRILMITLRYQGRESKPYITAIKHISKPGLRVYSNYKDIPKILGGMGVVILSTSKGIMIDREAREQKMGGEILCSIW